MFCMPRTNSLNCVVIILTAVFCLAFSGLVFNASAQNHEYALNATQEEVQTDPYFTEEIIDFEDDPEIVGHLKEEETSYASYEELMIANVECSGAQKDATSALSSNSTIADNAKSKPLVKLVPPKGRTQPNALRLFRFIPPTIFDNTIEGMREDEKQILMDTGETDFWVLTALSEDELVIHSKSPEADTQATLRLFRANNGDTVIAIGVSAGDSCALELWRYFEECKGIAPIAMPDEPAVRDFFETHRVLPEGTDVSMLICLDPVEEVLFAKPLIWTPSGLDQIKLDTRVYYIWNGNNFVKTVEALE